MVRWVAFAWVGGVWMAAWNPRWVDPTWALLALLATIVIAAVAVHTRSQLWSIVLAGAAWVGAMTSFRGQDSPIRSSAFRAQWVGRVVDVRHGADAEWVDVEALSGTSTDGQRIPRGHHVRFRMAPDTSPPVGSEVAVDGELRPARRFRNVSPHPRWPSATSFQYRTSIRAGSTLSVIRAPPLRQVVHRIQSRIRRHLRASLSPSTSAIARALVLGDGRAVSKEDRERVAKAGLAHLLAVSGLHIALLSGLIVLSLERALRFTGVVSEPRRLSAMFGVPLALAHALLAGGSPSAWRAATTAAIGWTVVALGRRPSPADVTGAAVLLLSGAQPKLAVRPAFLLSVVATAAILSTPPIRKGRFAALRGANALSWRTLAATTPIVWWCFGEVPWVSWWSNIALLPLASATLVPLANVYAVTTWWPSAAAWIEPLLESCTNAFLFCCTMLGQSFPSPELPPLTSVQGVALSIATSGLLLARGPRRWHWRIGAWVLGMCVWSLPLRPHTPEDDALEITFLDLGQGDAAWVNFPDGSSMLVDAGPGEYGAGDELRTWLQARRVRHIDTVVITHGHPDHYGGLGAVLESFSIGELWINGQTLEENSEGVFSKWVTQARRQGTRIITPTTGCDEPRAFGGAIVRWLSPCPAYDPGFDLNDNSIVLDVVFEGKRVLFTGDIEREREAMLAAAMPPTDILKVAHHGSKTSTTEMFLNRISPKVAVVSSGTGNRFGHPHGEVVRRLRRHQACILRTDQQGSVTARITSTGMRFTSWRARRWAFRRSGSAYTLCRASP